MGSFPRAAGRAALRADGWGKGEHGGGSHFSLFTSISIRLSAPRDILDSLAGEISSRRRLGSAAGSWGRGGPNARSGRHRGSPSPARNVPEASDADVGQRPETLLAGPGPAGDCTSDHDNE